jgi:hypothetical protein
LQLLAPGAGGNSAFVGHTYGTAGNTTGYQHGFSIANVGFAADKSGKDMNLRGLTCNPFNSTLYVSKGSGGNGINTVYQVGPGGIPTTGDASSLVFNILPGFSETSAASGEDSSGNPQTIYYPFGLWFADANTLYVADEGQVSTSPALVYDSVNNDYVNALPANNPTAGLQKWTFDGTKWNLVYTLQNGLNLGVPYSVPNDAAGDSYPTGVNPATGLPWTPSNNGLRNITGQVNGDGTVTIYGVTSTASGDTDQGADPNQLVAITDTLAATSPAGEAFVTLRTAQYGEVLRGVALAPGASTTIGASASPSAGGVTSGGGNAAVGSPVTVVATPNANYSFVNWTENGTPVSTSASYSFTATRSRALVANFVNVLAAGTAYYARGDNIPLVISARALLANVTDLFGYPVTLVGVGTDGANLLTATGANLMNNGTDIFYTNSAPSNVNDSFEYEVSDSQGNTALGQVVITMNNNLTGQASPNLILGSSTVTATFFGVPGYSYAVDRSLDLVIWTPIQTVTAPPGGVIQITDALGSPPPSAAYYRLRYNPSN